MKKTMMFMAGALLLLTACGGGLKSLTADNFKVDPSTLEAVGGQVQATINGMEPLPPSRERR